jgi:hypothetical protein
VLDLFYIAAYYYVYKQYNDIFINLGLFSFTFVLFYLFLNPFVLETGALILSIICVSTMYIKIRETLVTRDASFTNLQIITGGSINSVVWICYGLLNGYVAVYICNFYLFFTLIFNAVVYLWSIGILEDSNIVIMTLHMVLKTAGDKLDGQTTVTYDKSKLLNFRDDFVRSY